MAYVVFRRGEEVLLQLRRGTGYMDGWWSTAAAGHVEAGESVEEAAAREALEELGVVVAPADLMPLSVMHRAQLDGTDTARVDFFFTCTNWTGCPRVREADKASEVGWFAIDDLPHLLVPHERHVLERLQTGLPPIISHGFGTAGSAEPCRTDSRGQR
ncbi:NUDIX domain-containing protein [Arthrobacter sp. JSM 101049]|uniref:NUDIX domain-containing protein n=1 Tax=Arthrobacter sp. JSM 101049 TaxID=929097 RepID=UPI003569204F